MHETFDLGEYQCQLFGGHVRNICFVQVCQGVGICMGCCEGTGCLCLIQFVWGCLCGAGDMYDDSAMLG